MKRYKTWEMVKMLTENPDMQFKKVSDGLIFKCGTKISNCKEVGRYISQASGECALLTDEWELVQQPIPFMEAVKAYSEGKTIRCEWEGRTNNWVSIYKNGSLYKDMKECDGPICAKEILNGKWYVEDSHE
jgi:hypothetical protein